MSELSFADLRAAVLAMLARAADTLRRLPMPLQGKPSLPRSSWPDAPDAASDAYGYTPQGLPPLPPRPRAVSELDRVLPWLVVLDDIDRRLVWARALGTSWPRLAREFGLTVGQLRYRHEAAIDRIVAHAVRDSVRVAPRQPRKLKHIPLRRNVPA
ncbi:MAG TPA: DUF6362 family protein [Reyranellaceae bacterium]|nr:DUF6362 family protein [Reyranellaceae bacterium]